MTSSLTDYVVTTASAVFRQHVMPKDNMFDLGVDSLLMVEYCERLEARFGVEIDIEELFAADDLAGFATVLAQRVPAERLA